MVLRRIEKKNQKPKKNKNKKLCNATPTFSLFRHVPIGSADAIGRPEKEQLGTLPIPPMRERERETGAFLVDGLAKEAFDGLDSYRVFTASFQVSFIGFTVFNNNNFPTFHVCSSSSFHSLVEFVFRCLVSVWVCESGRNASPSSLYRPTRSYWQADRSLWTKERGKNKSLRRRAEKSAGVAAGVTRWWIAQRSTLPISFTASSATLPSFPDALLGFVAF